MIVQETSSAVPSPDLFFQTTPPIKSDAAHDNNVNPVTFALDVTGYVSILFIYDNILLTQPEHTRMTAPAMIVPTLDLYSPPSATDFDEL